MRNTNEDKLQITTVEITIRALVENFKTKDKTENVRAFISGYCGRPPHYRRCENCNYAECIWNKRWFSIPAVGLYSQSIQAKLV